MLLFTVAGTEKSAGKGSRRADFFLTSDIMSETTRFSIEERRQQENNMIFEEVLHAVDEMTDEERRRLQQHIDRLPKKSTQLTPKERMRRLNAAFDAMGEGMSQAQLDEMTAAMTEDYIEAWDESVWTQ